MFVMCPANYHAPPIAGSRASDDAPFRVPVAGSFAPLGKGLSVAGDGTTHLSGNRARPIGCQPVH